VWTRCLLLPQLFGVDRAAESTHWRTAFWVGRPTWCRSLWRWSMRRFALTCLMLITHHAAGIELNLSYPPRHRGFSYLAYQLIAHDRPPLMGHALSQQSSRCRHWISVRGDDISSDNDGPFWGTSPRFSCTVMTLVLPASFCLRLVTHSLLGAPTPMCMFWVGRPICRTVLRGMNGSAISICFVMSSL